MSMKYHRVRDHCCFTGKYRGAADRICNLNYRANEKKSNNIS